MILSCIFWYKLLLIALTLLKEITDRYNDQLSPYYAAARIWVDGIIDPVYTRTVVSMGIEAANGAPILRPYNVGVIQT